jgi:ribosomal protein S18 acetylase RimI-like enzyme
MVGGYREPEAAALVHLVAMWVRPDCRGMGLGRRLVTAVTEWAAETDGHRVELWVATGNTAAQNLYAHCGFTEVGSYQPLPSDPCTNETRMRLEV